jgi:amino acid transporter
MHASLFIFLILINTLGHVLVHAMANMIYIIVNFFEKRKKAKEYYLATLQQKVSLYAK